jgi:hypothetical protein
MNRQPAKVLAAAKRYGSVQIRTRDGEEYTVLSCAKTGGDTPPCEPDFKAHYERLRQAGWRPAAPAERARVNRLVNRLIAGEE